MSLAETKSQGQDLYFGPPHGLVRTFTLHARNIAGKPVLLSTSRFRVARLRITREIEERFEWLQPGDSFDIPLKGNAFFDVDKLSPYYRGPDSAYSSKEPRLMFNFKDVSADEVLKYVCEATGWIFALEKRIPGTLDAVSGTEIPISKVIDFLNAVLRRRGVFIVNPCAPDLPGPYQILRIVDSEP